MGQIMGIFYAFSRRHYFKALHNFWNAILGQETHAVLFGYIWTSRLVISIVDRFHYSNLKPVCVHVGANIGAESNDPVHTTLIKSGFWKQQNWIGVFIEPVPWTMQCLKGFYKELPGAEFLEIAIAKTKNHDTEYQTMFVPEVKDAPGKGAAAHGQLSTLNSDYSKMEHKQEKGVTIEEVEVKCMNFQNAMKSSIALQTSNEIDFLVVDVEGTNNEVMELIFESEIKAHTILFEHGSMYYYESIDKNAINNLKPFPGDALDFHMLYWSGKLCKMGYIVIVLSGCDMLAISVKRHLDCLKNPMYQKCFSNFTTLAIPQSHDLPVYRFLPFCYARSHFLSYLWGVLGRNYWK